MVILVTSSNFNHNDIRAYDFGLLPYVPTWMAMRRFTTHRDTTTTDELWLLQHEPVYTQGQAGLAEHIHAAGNIPIVQSDRGGQVTYHGPGQVILYLLLDMRRAGLGVRDLVTLLENTAIEVLAEFGVSAAADPEAPGVYVGKAKIAALGLRVHKSRSYHGLSLNIEMDLTPFSQINPCGMPDLPVVQLADFVMPVSLADVQKLLVQKCCGLLLRSVPEIKPGILNVETLQRQAVVN